MYDPADMPPPQLRSERRAGEPTGVLDERYAASPRLEEGDVARMRANYAGKVTLIDDQVGHLLRTLETRGELANTVIAFTSDHGEMNGDHGLIYKQNFLDGAVRVPMVLRTPATVRAPVAGQVCSSPVEWFDLGLTLVELSGGALTHQHFARSLVPAIVDPGVRIRAEALSEFRGEFMVVDDVFKMAVNRRGVPYMLFHRVQDPGEQHNLIGEPGMARVANDLRLRMLERLVQTQVHRPAVV
jgi:choline-sulfatase